ncbi:MAG: PQQ-dependent sugar dehydrogenase, partial [Nocardioidaceae bacterium]
MVVSAACVLSAVPLTAAGDAGGPAAVGTAAAAPTLRVRVVMRNLDVPWDTAFLPGGSMLVTERERRRILLRTPRGGVRVVANHPRGIWSSGETGLMSLAVDPSFRSNRRFYTCHGATLRGGRHDVRVVAWRLNRRSTRARRTEAMVRGIPARTGRHGGCRLEIGPSGRLWVGTGDAAIGRNPQRLRSLGGKVLRVNRFTGRGVRTNPYPRAPSANRRRVFTHGHRNVQGLAWRPGDGMWSVEHGPTRDDEVNRLVRRGDYGWHPVPGYNESVPMTNHRLRGPQRNAKWRSGSPTLAPSGATWLTHRRWGAWRGRLAVAMLKDSSLRVMRFSNRNRLISIRTPARLNNDFGRLRSVTLGPRGALYLTTSNGGGNDRVLRVV